MQKMQKKLSIAIWVNCSFTFDIYFCYYCIRKFSIFCPETVRKGGVAVDTQKYEVFLKVVQYGSFSKTALAMDYTQSGITHIIHSLEKAWGVTLFSKGYSGVALTPEGEHLLPLIRQICDAETKLQEEIGTLNGQQNTVVRIGTFSSVSIQYLPRVLQQFKQNYPNVGFKIYRGHYVEVERWLLNGEVDIGILPEPINAKLERKPILRDKLQVVLPHGHPLAEKPAIEAKDLEGEPFIMLDEGEDNEFEQFAQDVGVTLDIRYWIKDDHSVISMVENGLGISILHELFLQVLKNREYSVEIRDFVQPVYRDNMVAYLPHRKRSQMFKVLLKHLGAL